jgi:hypothetical protein
MTLNIFFLPLAQLDILQHALFPYQKLIAPIFDKQGVSQECVVVRLIFLRFLTFKIIQLFDDLPDPLSAYAKLGANGFQGFSL